MGRWMGLADITSFGVSERERLTTKTCSTKKTMTIAAKYRKLDVVSSPKSTSSCKNCGSASKTEKKMATRVCTSRNCGSTPSTPSTTSSRLRTTPKQFLTWSATAANTRLQKMSKNLVFNVSKLGSRMTLPAFQHHENHGQDPSSITGSNLSLDSGGFSNSRFGSQEDINDLSDGGFKSDAPVVKSVILKRNITLQDNLWKSKNGDDDNNININNSVSNVAGILRRKSYADLSSRTSIYNTDSLNNINNNNNSVIVNNNLNCKLINDPDKPTNEEEAVIRMELKSGQCFYNSSFSMFPPETREFDGFFKNNSSTTINSAATTVQMQSPHGSRGSSFSINLRSPRSHCHGEESVGLEPRRSKDVEEMVGDNNRSGLLIHSAVLSSSASSSSSISSSSPPCSPASSSSSSSSVSSSTEAGAVFNSPLVQQVSAPSTKVSLHRKLLPLFKSPGSADSEKLLSPSGGNASRRSGKLGAVHHRHPNNNSNNKASTMPAPSSIICRGSDGITNKCFFVSQTLPPSKLTVTTLEEEEELKVAAWFQAGIPREIALEVLRNEPLGSFIVRESTTKAGCFALSLRVPRETQPSGIAHYLILKTGKGYKIKGFTKEFGSLSSLITHHSVMPELLPCPLSLHRYRPSGHTRTSRNKSSDFVEPEKLLNTFYTRSPTSKFTDF